MLGGKPRDVLTVLVEGLVDLLTVLCRPSPTTRTSHIDLMTAALIHEGLTGPVAIFVASKPELLH